MSLRHNELMKVCHNHLMWHGGLGELARFFARISMRSINFVAKTTLRLSKQILKAKFTWKVHILQATVTFCTLSVVVSNSGMWYFLIFCNSFRYLSRTAQHRAFVWRTRQKIREAASLGLFHLTVWPLGWKLYQDNNIILNHFHPCTVMVFQWTRPMD